jgi:hypothetical protein
MGDAKRRRAVPIVYHHSSVVAQNLMWMQGELLPGGPEPVEVPHPRIAHFRIGGAEAERRACKDFPPLVWFTSRIKIPACLRKLTKLVIYAKDQSVFESEEFQRDLAILDEEYRKLSTEDLTNAYRWNRTALGFPLTSIPAVRWCDYPGYGTPEGKDLNETAIEAGDNPRDWYVSETPIDIMQMTEFWASRSVWNPQLEKLKDYVRDVKVLVEMSRAAQECGKKLFIPPSWMNQDDAVKMVCDDGVNQKVIIKLSGRAS